MIRAHIKPSFVLRPNGKGMVLVGVVLLMSVLTLLSTASILSTRTGFKLSSNYRSGQEVYYVAQAGAEYGLNRLRAAVLISPLNTSSVVPPTIPGYTFENTGSFLAASGVSETKTVTGQYAGLTATCQKYIITSSVVKNNTNARATVVYEVEDQSIPLFQFGIIFDGNMEIMPGSAMNFGTSGRLHSNSNLYLYPSGTLNVDSVTTSYGSIYNTRLASSGGGTGAVNIKDSAGNYQSMTSPTTLTSSTSTWRADAIARWGGRVKSDDHDIQPLEMQLPSGRSPIDILAKPGDTNYNSSISLYAKSGLRIVKSHSYTELSPYQYYQYLDKNGNYVDLAPGAISPPVTYCRPDVMSMSPRPLPVSCPTNPPWLPHGSYPSDTFIYDGRQGFGMDAITIDIDKLRKNSVAMAKLNDPPAGGQKGLLYVSLASGNYTDPAVRLINGATLPRDAAHGGTDLFNGLSIVSDRPIYIQGDFNTVNTQPAGIFADAVTVLSNAWSDANSWSAIGSRTASNTTVNANIMAGIKNTVAGGQYSGGVENFIRLLENWSGRTLTYTGSLACLWQGVQTHLGYASTADWPGTGTVYNPPTRIWSFGTSFADQPPGTPSVRCVQRISSRQVLN
jgi:hypothetical protein